MQVAHLASGRARLLSRSIIRDVCLCLKILAWYTDADIRLALLGRHEVSQFSRCSTPIPAAIRPSAMPTAGRCDTPTGPGRLSRGQDGARSHSRCTHPATRHPFLFIGPGSQRRHRPRLHWPDISISGSIRASAQSGQLVRPSQILT